MKDNKTTTIEFRLTPTEKETIKTYCKNHGMSMSEFIRMACVRIFSQEEK